MEYGTIYFLDASALVKLVIQEDGSPALSEFIEKGGPFYTTLICFGEALGVLKRKRFAKNGVLTQEAYIATTNYLRSLFTSNVVHLEGPEITAHAVFFESADLSDKYGIDLSDALQIVTVRASRIVGATLITADEALANAARAERIIVWDCLREAPPKT